MEHTSLPILATFALAASGFAQSSWSAPVNVTALNSTASENGPQLSADGLTMHFSSYRTSNWDIYSATRPTKTSPWNPPVQELGLSDPVAVDGEPFMRADGLEIFFTSSRTGTLGAADIMRATRPTTSSPWSAPTFVTELNSTYQDGAPSLTGDGLTMYLLSASVTPPNATILVASRPNLTSPFSTPVVVPELVVAGSATRDVEITADGLSILYYRLIGSQPDLFIATRKKRSDPFGVPQAFPELRAPSGTSNLGGTLSADGGTMFFIRIYGSNPAGEIMESRFDGLSHAGIASKTTSMNLLYRDTASPGLVFAGALALGGTGFPLGTRTVPLDPDALFIATFGTNVPLFTTGYAGLLDAAGETNATITCGLPAVVGLTVWTGFFTLDVSAPYSVKTISNSFPIEFVP